MEEPTLAEEVRRLADEIRRLTDAQQTYVTREILELKLVGVSREIAAAVADQKEDRARLDNMSRIVWSALIAPVIVGVILYFLTGGGS